MRLTENNIKYVGVIEYNGMPYTYYVAMKSSILDTRDFINYDENGRTTIKEYKKEWLPKSVQKFMTKHNPVIIRGKGQLFTEYRYM